MQWHHILAVCATSLLLAACGGEDSGSGASAAPASTSPGTTPANRAPLISGTPPTSVRVGDAFSFQPSAADADGDALQFSVSGLPGWASFDASTGALSGTPSASDVGVHEGIRISVSDGRAAAALAAFAITVQSGTAGAPANRAPTISGTAPAQAVASTAWSFQPAAADADGDALVFAVSNLPRWAQFDAATGRVFGTPGSGDIGTYTNIRISVSDGVVTVTLPAFAVEVIAQALGQATLSWAAPTENSDGSALVDLAGYRIHYGTAANNLSRTATIDGTSVQTATIDDLTAGTWYFAMTSFNHNGIESEPSETVSKLVR
jgi:hypothetical protein